MLQEDVSSMQPIFLDFLYDCLLSVSDLITIAKFHLNKFNMPLSHMSRLATSMHFCLLYQQY